MNVRSSVFSASVAALSLVGSILLSSAPAQAFGLSFSPAGEQDGLPNDDIRDLDATPNSTVVFKLLFDSGNLSESDRINEISLIFGFDSTELLNPLISGSPIPTILGAESQKLTYSNLNIAGDSGIKTLGTISFTTASILKNDGLSDFNTLLLEAKGLLKKSDGSFMANNDFMISEPKAGNIPQITKQVEVQGPMRAVPTPALLPGMVAFGLGLVRKRKQELVG
jgi:hypothetical protein